MTFNNKAAAFCLMNLMACSCLINPSTTHAEEPVASTKAAANTDERDDRSLQRKLNERLDPVKFDKVPAKEAFAWWSKNSGVPLVINWPSLEQQGVESEAPITLELRNVPAEQLLRLMLQQLSPEPMIYERTPWYVQVSTKAEANKRLVTRVYAVGDLLHDPSPVSSPPSFDLSASLSSSGGSGSSGSNNSSSSGSSSSSLFQNSTSGQSSKPARSDVERSGDLTKLIRDTIEPEVWSENGGAASISFYNGRLIVKAPLYVQEQLGIPETSHAVVVNPDYKAPERVGENSNGVSAVNTIKPVAVAGKEEK